MLYNKFHVMLYNMYACYVKSHLSSCYLTCVIKFLVISHKKRYVI